jgi:hypothetical protein
MIGSGSKLDPDSDWSMILGSEQPGSGSGYGFSNPDTNHWFLLRIFFLDIELLFFLLQDGDGAANLFILLVICFSQNVGIFYFDIERYVC